MTLSPLTPRRRSKHTKARSNLPEKEGTPESDQIPGASEKSNYYYKRRTRSVGRGEREQLVLTRIPGCRGRGRRRRARRRAWGGRATPSCARRRRARRPRRRWRRQGRGGGGRRARWTAPWLGSRSRARVRGLSAEAQRRREWISSRLLASRVRLGGREKRDKGRGKFLWRRKRASGRCGGRP